MNLTSKAVLETALSHRSIRRFTEEPITEEQLTSILEAGRAASTSNFLQCTHIIRVNDMQVRQDLRAIGRNLSSIDTCAELLVFCADFAKHKHIAPEAQLDWTEITLIGAVDAGIMAQNVMLAAESLGLGGVYLGYIRNDINRTAEILKLPQYVVPLFGMALGHPDQNPLMRPRLPLEAIISENSYQAINDELLNEYNEIVKDYYVRRSNTDSDWSEPIRSSLSEKIRPEVLPFLNKQGLTKR